jgi:hypothetical protein
MVLVFTGVNKERLQIVQICVFSFMYLLLFFSIEKKILKNKFISIDEKFFFQFLKLEQSKHSINKKKKIHSKCLTEKNSRTTEYIYSDIHARNK